MKEIIAIIRSGAWPATSAKLLDAGFYAFTRQRVHGRGKQKGLRYSQDESHPGITTLPKWMLTLVVEEQEVGRAVEAIQAANRTGEIGDGKIFVCPVLESVRIRTDEKGVLALK